MTNSTHQLPLHINPWPASERLSGSSDWLPAAVANNHPSYPDYGGRGITICERWRDSFENFLADMKEKPKGKRLCASTVRNRTAEVAF